MARLDNLYKWLVYTGLEVHTLAGWSTRGSASFNPKISMTHWIAGVRGARPGTRPGLAIVRDGRAGLPGPLCQVYLGRAGEAVVVASGRANHAGRGSYLGVTGNTGAAGVEAEAADNNDWTAAQKAAYPLVHVAILLAMWERGTITWGQITADRVVGHSEYALPKGRKVDVNGYTMDQLRSQVGALIPGFKSRVGQKAISVGTAPVYDIAAGAFTDGQKVDVPTSSTGGGSSSGSSGGSSGGSSRTWPDVALPVTDKHTTASHNAWVKLLTDVGYKDSSLTLKFQKWLRDLGYYTGRIDDDFGGWTVEALQRFLRDRGFYRGRIDGKRLGYAGRGPMTIRAEIAYLNSQRRFY